MGGYESEAVVLDYASLSLSSQSRFHLKKKRSKKKVTNHYTYTYWRCSKMGLY